MHFPTTGNSCDVIPREARCIHVAEMRAFRRRSERESFDGVLEARIFAKRRKLANVYHEHHFRRVVPQTRRFFSEMSPCFLFMRWDKKRPENLEGDTHHFPQVFLNFIARFFFVFVRTFQDIVIPRNISGMIINDSEQYCIRILEYALFYLTVISRKIYIKLIYI